MDPITAAEYAAAKVAPKDLDFTPYGFVREDRSFVGWGFKGKALTVDLRLMTGDEYEIVFNGRDADSFEACEQGDPAHEWMSELVVKIDEHVEWLRGQADDLAKAADAITDALIKEGHRPA
jgi:hypothetical protein